LLFLLFYLQQLYSASKLCIREFDDIWQFGLLGGEKYHWQVIV